MRGKVMSVPFVRVASVEDVRPGHPLLVDVDGRSIALFLVDDRYYAIDDICTHDGGPLVEGAVDGYEVECPRHGARFDIRNGKALCMPAFEPVTTHSVERRGDDLFVAVED